MLFLIMNPVMLYHLCLLLIVSCFRVSIMSEIEIDPEVSTLFNEMKMNPDTHRYAIFRIKDDEDEKRVCIEKCGEPRFFYQFIKQQCIIQYINIIDVLKMNTDAVIYNELFQLIKFQWILFYKRCCIFDSIIKLITIFFIIYHYSIILSNFIYHLNGCILKNKSHQIINNIICMYLFTQLLLYKDDLS